MLIARNSFEAIHFGFLLVGHTHEELYQYFNCLSNNPKTTKTFVLSDLITILMESLLLSFFYMIHEVIDVNSFIKGYVDEIKGGRKRIFRFYVNRNEGHVL